MVDNNRIRVLHIIKSFKLGGAETNLRNLIKGMDSTRIETHVAYSIGGPFESWFRQHGAFLYKYADRDYKVQSLSSLKIILKLAVYMRRHRIQLVHTHNYSSHVWGALAAKLAGVRILEHVHDFRFEEAEYNIARGVNPSQFRLIKYTTRLSDKVVVLTQNNRNFLLRHHIVKDNKIKVLLNGICLDNRPQIDIKQLRAKFGIKPEQKVILTAARISKEKNIQLVVDIARIIKANGLIGNILFLVAGEGPERVTVEEKVGREKLEEHIKFIGFYPNVLELLAISEIFLQPTFLELHSITMLEAMTMGVPILVSKDVGCNSDFITHGVNGFLLDPFIAVTWAETIQQLLNNTPLSKHIGQQGQALVEKECDIKTVVERFETLYQEMLKG